jgi:sarcosine oxidase gamma subunit
MLLPPVVNRLGCFTIGWAAHKVVDNVEIIVYHIARAHYVLVVHQ